MKTDIEDPVLFVAAASDEVYSFAGLQNLVRKVVRQESRDHNIVQLVLLSPELVVAYIGVGLDEELLEGVINLSCQHPGLDHREDWRGDFL